MNFGKLSLVIAIAIAALNASADISNCPKITGVYKILGTPYNISVASTALYTGMIYAINDGSGFYLYGEQLFLADGNSHNLAAKNDVSYTVSCQPQTLQIDQHAGARTRTLSLQSLNTDSDFVEMGQIFDGGAPRTYLLRKIPGAPTN